MKRQTFPSKSGVTTLLATALLAFAFDVQPATVPAQEKPAAAPTDRAARPLIRVPTALPLDEARVIVEAAKAVVKADNGRAAIAVVDFNGNLVSLDSMDGTSGFWVKFAIGKAMGAVTLATVTAESADQLQTNPQRFHSALSLMEGQIISDTRRLSADRRQRHRRRRRQRRPSWRRRRARGQSRYRRVGKISPGQTLV